MYSHRASMTLGPLPREASSWTAKALEPVESLASIKAFRATTAVVSPISIVPVTLWRSMIISSVYSLAPIVLITISQTLMSVRPVKMSIVASVGTSVGTSVTSEVSIGSIITASIISCESAVVTLVTESVDYP